MLDAFVCMPVNAQIALMKVYYNVHRSLSIAFHDLMKKTQQQNRLTFRSLLTVQLDHISIEFFSFLSSPPIIELKTIRERYQLFDSRD